MIQIIKINNTNLKLIKDKENNEQKIIGTTHLFYLLVLIFTLLTIFDCIQEYILPTLQLR